MVKAIFTLAASAKPRVKSSADAVSSNLFMVSSLFMAQRIDRPGEPSGRFGSSDRCIEPVRQIRGKFETETRPRRNRDETVLHLRQRGRKIAIPGAIVGAHAFLNERVRRIQREMGRGAEHDRSGAVMRRDGQVPG